MRNINGAQPYKPYSAGDGDSFIARFCRECKKNKKFAPCSIMAAAYSVPINDPLYPRQWIKDQDGPRCTAYLPKNPPTPADRQYLAWRQANGSQG